MTAITPHRRLGLLVSGRGSNLQALLGACRDGRLAAVAAVAISNHVDAGALERARRMGVPTQHLDLNVGSDAADEALLRMLTSHRVELMLLAGYLRPIGSRVLTHYRGRILNVHPGPLPEFGGRGMYGLHVHRAVLAAGRTTTAAVIHLVEEGYDTGPVLAEREVPIQLGDTPESLAKRVLAEEHALYVETLQRILGGELRLPGFDGKMPA